MTAKQFDKKLTTARQIAARCEIAACAPPAWVRVMMLSARLDEVIHNPRKFSGKSGPLT